MNLQKFAQSAYQKAKLQNNQRRKQSKPQKMKKSNDFISKNAPSYKDTSSYASQNKSIQQNGYGKTLALNKSTALFAQVYGDPFKTDGARLPSFPIVSSQLVRTYASSKGVLNSQGNGWIFSTMMNGITNDLATVLFTSGPTAPDSFSWSGAGGITQSTTNSDYDHTPFIGAASSFNKAARLVALGLRVRYTGTTLNAGGNVYKLQMQPMTPEDNLDGFTPDTIKQYPGFKEDTFRDASWHAITRHIQNAEDTKFQYFNDEATEPAYPFGTWAYTSNGVGADVPTSFDGRANIGMYMTGVAGQPFEWEFVGHYEIVGPNLTRRGITTADTRGTESVVTSYSKMRHKDSSTPDHSVGKPSTDWMSILKKGAEYALPLIPKIAAMFL